MHCRHLAIKVAAKRLRQDATLLQRTSLPVEDIIDLLSFCLNATYFVFEGCYYQQVFGTAMGSPVLGVIANLVIEDVEIVCLQIGLYNFRQCSDSRNNLAIRVLHAYCY